MKRTPGFWDVGRTLDTPQTRRWPKKVVSQNNAVERQRVFASFTPEDQGKGRILVADCSGSPDGDANARFIAAGPDMERGLIEIRNSIAFVLPSLPKKLQPGMQAIMDRAGRALSSLGT